MSIVGVVADLKNQALNAEARQEMYVPYVQANFAPNQNFTPYTIGLVVRAAFDPVSLSRAITPSIHPSAFCRLLPPVDEQQESKPVPVDSQHRKI
jgi:hypothetical protein